MNYKTDKIIIPLSLILGLDTSYSVFMQRVNELVDAVVIRICSTS